MFGGRLHFACVLVGALGIASFARPAQAELMLDRVPEDAVLCVGWQGTDALGETFSNSHFSAIRNAAKADRLLTSMLPMAGLLLGEQGGQVTQFATQLDRVLWERPWAVFVAGPASDDEGSAASATGLPTLRLGLIIDAGPHASQVSRALNQWEGSLNDGDVPATRIDEDGVMGLMVGYDEQQVREVRILWRSLSRNNGFNNARRQVMHDPALLAYVDTERLIGQLAEMVAMLGFVDAAQVDATVTELGLDGLKRVVYAGGFQERMWQGQLFIEAPAPRRGLVKLFDAEPVTDRELRIVPRSATWLSAYRLDPAVALAALHAAVPVSIDGAGPFDAGAREALAAGLGDLWLFYSDPSFHTPAGPGIALVHPLRDTEPVEAALQQMTAQFNAGGPEGPAVEPVVIEGVTIHQAAMPDGSLTLAWAVADGRLYVGTGAQTVAAARDHAGRPGNGLTQSNRFQRMRERLGGPDASARLTFADLQSTAPAMFQSYGQAMGLDAGGFNPGINLPDLRQLMPYLFPSGQVGWADDLGWHARSIGPIPGASLLSPCATVNLGTGTAAAAMLFNVPLTTVAGP